MPEVMRLDSGFLFRQVLVLVSIEKIEILVDEIECIGCGDGVGVGETKGVGVIQGLIGVADGVGTGTPVVVVVVIVDQVKQTK